MAFIFQCFRLQGSKCYASFFSTCKKLKDRRPKWVVQWQGIRWTIQSGLYQCIPKTPNLNQKKKKFISLFWQSKPLTCWSMLVFTSLLLRILAVGGRPVSFSPAVALHFGKGQIVSLHVTPIPFSLLTLSKHFQWWPGPFLDLSLKSPQFCTIPQLCLSPFHCCP